MIEFQFGDEVIIADQASEFFARCGRVCELGPRGYGIDTVGPRPVGYLWFIGEQLIPYSVDAHVAYKYLTKDFHNWAVDVYNRRSRK